MFSPYFFFFSLFLDVYELVHGGKNIIYRQAQAAVLLPISFGPAWTCHCNNRTSEGVMMTTPRDSLMFA